MNRTGNEPMPSVPPQGLKGTDTDTDAGNATTSRKSSSSNNNISSTRFCSSLALRPPLPPVATTTDDGVVVVGAVGNPAPAPAPTGDSAATSTATDEDEPEQAPGPSFLARMCVACEVLVLATETRFTALVLLHRYARARKQRGRMRQRMRQQERERGGSTAANHQEEDDDDDGDGDDDWPWIGAACILLACKAEEEPRRLRDVVNVARMVLSNHGSNRDKGNHRDGIGDGTNAKTNSTASTAVVVNLTRPPPLDDRYWESKQKVIETEQMVLSWLGFDCSVSHPHRAVHQILDRELAGERVARNNRDGSSNGNGNGNGNGNVEPPNKRARVTKDSRDGTNRDHDSDRNRNRDQLVSLAFRRLNDALVHPEALRWGVTELACAALDLAAEDPAADTHQKHTAVTNSTILDSDSSNTDPGGVAIFRNEWWRRYKVCSERFRGCRSSLREATSRLEAMAMAKATSKSEAATSRGHSATADPI